MPDERVTALGETISRGRRLRFGMLQPDRLRHLYILGKTGAGKSTLMGSLIAQDLEAGQGLAVLDPHGDLAREALTRIPRRRKGDLTLFSPASSPLSFNVFRQGRRLHPSPSLLTSELISTFRAQWSSSWGPRLEHVLRNAILAIASDQRANLLFLYHFLTNESLREKVIEKIKDPVVRHFWSEEWARYPPRLQGEALSPVLNKLGAFVAQPLVRSIVGQPRSRLDVGRLMDRGGILLADLSTGAVGEDASHLLGALLLSAIQLAASARPRGGPSFIVYADEFQNFVSDSIATMLAEARKYGVGLVLAHQYLAQLPEGVHGAVLGNVGSMVVFRIGSQDARTLEPEFTPAFTAHDLQSLGPQEVAVKLLVRGKEVGAFGARTMPCR